MIWISFAQLFVDFALSTGESGPLNIGGWKDASDLPLHGLLAIGFKRRARSFAKVLLENLIYDLTETFFFPNAQTKEICNCRMIEIIFPYSIPTDTDSICIFFIFYL